MTITFVHLANLVAIAALVGLFCFRSQRRELVVAYLAVNVGVMAVATALASSPVSAGLGLGIFGVLSIIRLRSEELSQSEIAYYFAALALGLLGGLGTNLAGTVVLMVAVVAVIWLGDHSLVSRRTARQELVLDRAFTNQSALAAHVEALLGVVPTMIEVKRTDVVNETTLVVVVYPEQARRRHEAPALESIK